MAENWEEIMGAALSLPPGLRAMLAEHLLESLDAESQSEIDASWAEAVETRVAEIDTGKVALVSGDEIMQRLKSRR